MKRLTLGTLVLGMCLFCASEAQAQDLGFIPVFDEFGNLINSSIFQIPAGRDQGSILIDNRPLPQPARSFQVINAAPPGNAIVGICSDTTADCFGVAGVGGRGGAGVIGRGDAPFGRITGIGVDGFSESGTAVRGRTRSGTAGVFETSPGSGDILIGMSGGTRAFRVDADGSVFAAAYNIGGADFAESVEPAGQKNGYEAGDVVVIDHTAVRRVALSQQPYSTPVAGIYSTKPGMLASPYHMDDPRLAKEIPLAIVGIVPCKVSAENGPVEAGDLLVTSATPGHAMKGTDRSRMLGAVVGKALEPLPSSKGVIQVLVTLQ